MNSHAPIAIDGYELRFESLSHAGQGLTFPCDARGGVCLDGLSARARQNYLFARAVVGRDFARPVVLPCGASAH